MDSDIDKFMYVCICMNTNMDKFMYKQYIYIYIDKCITLNMLICLHLHYQTCTRV
jgi:hypothetical protein